MKRPAGCLPVCKGCPKIATGDEPKPENANDLSERNWKMYMKYLEVKAGAKMPEDDIFRRNCALIRMVEDRHERGLLGAGADMLQIMGRSISMAAKVKR